MMSKAQQVELIATLRQGRLDFTADVATLRAVLSDLMSRIPIASDVDYGPTTIGGVNALDVTIRDVDTTNTILYFHGGVYVVGSAAESVPLVSDLARRARAKAVTVDYRLAPEHPHPAAIDDAVAAYRGLLDSGTAASAIAIAGESAVCGADRRRVAAATTNAGLDPITAPALLVAKGMAVDAGRSSDRSFRLAEPAKQGRRERPGSVSDAGRDAAAFTQALFKAGRVVRSRRRSAREACPGLRAGRGPSRIRKGSPLTSRRRERGRQ
jgi:hypothetical protein